ncbi:MAG: hypothetical protein P8Q48_24670 [Paracoccaceae bacterium]|nr:hypothetical protein [Paracoccaceae bacterium]MDG1373386.1 hypothetical protein [Paracoccaceae bacterium]
MTKLTNRENGNSTGRSASGRFTAGNPGRPPGTRHKATQAALTLLEGEAEALSRKAVELAIEGDTTALRLCLERIAPPRKDTPVQFDLPPMQSAADAASVAGAVLDTVAQGNLTPTEGAHVMGLVEGFRRTLETTELEARIIALEESAA